MTSRTPRRRLAVLPGAVALAAAGMTSGALAHATTEPPADSIAADVDRTDWPDSIRFAVVPGEESSNLEEEYATSITLFNEELGLDVEIFQATDYAGVIEAAVAGEVDIAYLGPFAYVIAIANGAAIVPVGAMVDAPDAAPGYYSYGIARSDNDEINSIEDFAGKNVCYADPGSTSGFLYPSAGLLAAGIDPETDVNPVFAGGHDASVLSVVNGDCDAGFAYDRMVTEELIATGDIEDGDVKIVWESELIVGSPVTMSTNLPQSLQDEIARVILEETNTDALVASGRCADAESCVINDNEGSWGYIPVDDAFYDSVREVCDATEAEACGAA